MPNKKKPNIRASIKLISLLAATTLLLVPYLLAYPFGRKPRRLFAYPFFRLCVRYAGLDITVKGKLEKTSAKLYIANHVSYLDIPILASLVDGLFVAKSDVANWPVIGFLARISQTHFVSRKATHIPKERERIARRLEKGDAIFLFPEGSSGNGSDLLPFKPGLLSTALITSSKRNIEVQPITITYGPGVSQSKRDQYAWYGEMDLAPHMWLLLSLSEKLAVTVTIHDAESPDKFNCRKELAIWAQSKIQSGLNEEFGSRESHSLAS